MSSVVLIGYMGCGKSSLGVRLSYKRKSALLDTDREIERIQKTTISEIFATQGEAAFRDMETEFIKKLLGKKADYVISTGGGLPIREENRALLKQCGTVVYLRTRPDTIYERVKADTGRPLLQCDNPRKKIEEMLEQRKEAYESCADVIVDTDELDLVALAELVEEKVEAFMKQKKGGSNK